MGEKRIVLCMLLFLVACTRPAKQEDIIQHNATVLKARNDFDTARVTTYSKGESVAQANISTLPFGCQELTNFHYPKRWKGHEEGLILPQGNEFLDLGDCFRKINSVGVIGNVQVNELEIVKVGDDANQFGFDTSAILSIDSCLYHLPNSGPYECYYFYASTKLKPLGEYGNLLLLDPVTRKGKLLNIFYEYAGEQHVKYRYFLFDGINLHLYEGYCYDDGCNLAEAFNIEIQQNGIVNIKQIK